MMKVLIAEDNKTSRLLLERTLEKMGFDVVSTDNGFDAWNILRSDSSPQLAILDWMMPGLDGVEVCRKVRDLNGLYPPYIVLLTARHEKEDLLKAFESGADDYIIKPFDRDELLARIRVGQRLVQKQVLLNSLIDSIPDAVFFEDEQGLFLGCNKAFEKIATKPRAELLGKKLSDNISLFHHFPNVTDKVMETHESIQFESETLSEDGEMARFENIIAPIQGPDQSVGGLIGISHDITRRSRIESEHRRLATVIEQSTESICITNTEGTIEYVNMAFEKVTGYAAAEIVGKNIRVLKSSKHESMFYEDVLSTVVSGLTWNGHVFNRCKDGSTFEAEGVIFSVRNRKDEITNFVSMMSDATQERLLEEQLRQAQKMNAVGLLAGGVAHDFNNLLMVIRNSAQFIESDATEGSDTAEDAQAIIDAAGRAASLTRQLLAFSRKQILDIKSVDVNQTVRGVESMLKRLVPENIRIDISLHREPCTIRADVAQLEQVIVNMVINARDAMPGGGGLCLETSIEKITPEHSLEFIDLLKEAGEYVVLKLSDTGHGMDAETQKHIFEPFFTTKGVGKGTGLGLSTAYGIIRQHKGHVSVYSEPDQGTTFKVYLPLECEKASSDAKGETQVARKGSETILLVEDEPFVLNIGVRMLSSIGYAVLSASNGVEALQVLEQNPAVDLLFTDVVMPEMDGTELAAKVYELYPKIKILFASGYSEFHIKESGLLDKNANLLQKPYELVHMAAKVREILDA
jgi:PAS domain S-box-containing protein